MRTRDLMNTQKVFNAVAEFLVYAPVETRCKDNFFENCDDGTIKVCAIGSLASKQERKYNNIARVVNYVDSNLVSEIENINDKVKLSRQPQKLRALAKKLELKIPEFLQKQNLGY